MEKKYVEQEEGDSYRSLEEFQEELVNWGKNWIAHYCEAAVESSPEGELALIKSRVIFKKELTKLCEEAFSEKEKQEYREQTQRLMEQMSRLHAKSRQTIAQGGMVTMEYLYRVFGFEEFEWYVFCMAYLPEADEQFNRVFVLLQDDFDKKAPSIDLCVRMYTLDEEERYRLKNRLLERWDFLAIFLDDEIKTRMGNGKRESILSVPLYLDRRIVRFIYDMNSEDSLLEKVVTSYLPSDMKQKLLIREKELARLEKMYRSAGKQDLIYLSGEKGIGKKFLVRQLGKKWNLPILMVDTKRLLELEMPLDRLMERLARETVLKGRAIVCFTDIPGEEEDFSVYEEILHSLEKRYLVAFMTSELKWKKSVQTGSCRCMEMELPALTVEERQILWKEALRHSRLKGNVDIDRLARTYRLSSGSIEHVIQEVEVRQLTGTQGDSLEKALYEGCQGQLVHSLGKDAVRVPVQYTMEELVLPESQKKLLEDACNMVKYHHHVFETWGFHKKMAYGKGVSMIFYGPPGTGKTMGAQAIANELNLELYRVDMASVLSKYVGESEKKLDNIFEQGQKSQSILFFDEADALFGKRSEVKESQDKYANASTAFLLQKLEEYQGIIILATNLLQNFDQAFCRRFQFIVEFPFPDQRRRNEIWQGVFPQELPKDELDYLYLAEEFELSGSQIKNIAVGAAFLAAGEGRNLGMSHILRTIKREMKKTGKNMIASDFGAYYSLMEQEEGVV